MVPYLLGEVLSMGRSRSVSKDSGFRGHSKGPYVCIVEFGFEGPVQRELQKLWLVRSFLFSGLWGL